MARASGAESSAASGTPRDHTTPKLQKQTIRPSQGEFDEYRIWQLARLILGQRGSLSGAEEQTGWRPPQIASAAMDSAPSVPRLPYLIARTLCVARLSGVFYCQHSKLASVHAANDVYCRWQGPLGADGTSITAADVMSGTIAAVHGHSKTHLKSEKSYRV